VTRNDKARTHPFLAPPEQGFFAESVEGGKLETSAAVAADVLKAKGFNQRILRKQLA
jgi:hypothetical protein